MGKFTILPDTVVVRTREDAKHMLARLRKAKVLAVDTETTGLDYARDYAIIISISTGNDRYVIYQEAFRYVRDLLQDPKRLLVMHNAKFDLIMLLNAGIDTMKRTPRKRYRVIDTMVMHHMVDDDRPHSLKYATLELLGLRMKEFSEVFGEELKTRTLTEVLLDPSLEKTVAHYAGLDAWATFHVFVKLKRKLMAMVCRNKTNIWREMENQWDLYKKLELRFTRVLYECEKVGFPVREDLLLQFAAKYEDEIAQHRRKLVQLTRDPSFKPGSTKQIAAMLYDKLGYDCTEFTETGAPATGEKILKGFANTENCEFCKTILEFRAASKKLKTYVLAPLRMAHKGKVHPRYLQTGTATGRIAARDPNIMNQPMFIREAYWGGKDYILYSRDFSQVEIRIFAALSGDEKLKQSILNGDPHSAVAALMFGESYEDIYEAKRKDDADEPLTDADIRFLKLRKAAKALNFGLLYGMGIHKLARELGVALETAEEYMDLYFQAMPGAKQAQEEMIEFAEEMGYAETMFGSRRYLHGFMSILYKDLSASERQAKNTPVQGTAGKLAALSMISCYESELLHEHGVELLTQVHDELVWRIPRKVFFDKKIWPVLEQEIRDRMEKPEGFDLGVPLATTGRPGENWMEAK